jgi:twinkle protein
MTFVKHRLPCHVCGSSDAVSENEDGSKWCFKCQRHVGEKNKAGVGNPLPPQIKTLLDPSEAFYGAFPDRRISSDTARSLEVKTSGSTVLFNYHNNQGDRVAMKTRYPDKSFKVSGDWKDTTLFLQHLYPKGGQYITITEGEFDAMAVWQMMGGYPVVSVRNGAGGAVKDCQDNYEWLDSFDKVVICFDNDKPGIEAANKVAELFSGKALIVKHNNEYKDACDYLKARQEKLFHKLWWSAQEYKPEGIVTVADIREQLLSPPERGLPWCFPALTDLTFGRRKGELYAFGAGVGVGKTDVFTQQIAYDIEQLGLRVGVIYLEQAPSETAQRIAGKLDGNLYHVPDGGWTMEEYKASIDRLIDMDKLFMMNHFGAKSWAEVKKAIRYFAKAKDIQVIYLDHLTALSANEEDERRALDAIMADMAGLAQSDGLIIHFVSHLTTPDGKPHEEGGRVMEKHFTGSRAIARWAHYMFGLERNKQHEDPEMRQVTKFRILKDRFTGRATGHIFHMKYNKGNGLLSEYQLSEDF